MSCYLVGGSFSRQFRFSNCRFQLFTYLHFDYILGNSPKHQLRDHKVQLNGFLESWMCLIEEMFLKSSHGFVFEIWAFHIDIPSLDGFRVLLKLCAENWHLFYLIIIIIDKLKSSHIKKPSKITVNFLCEMKSHRELDEAQALVATLQNPLMQRGLQDWTIIN